MANILGLITVNNKEVLEVDASPSAGGGTPASIGSLAFLESGGVGTNYIKVGVLDTAWDTITTLAAGNVGLGTYLRLPIYNTNLNGYTVDDTVPQNGFNIDVAIQDQPGRLAALEYRMPNPGNSVSTVDFILSEGAQTKNGDMTFNHNVTVQGNFTVNGTLSYLNSTNTQIKDALITLNKGGPAASGGASGIEVEEDSIITGYWKVASDRNGWDLLAPNVAFKNDLDLSNLTANRVQKFADTSGTFIMRPDGTPGVAGQVPFFSDANNLISEANLFWDATNDRLGVGTNAPTDSIDNAGTLRLRPMTIGSVLFAGTNGVVTQDNANFFWDDTNNRLGLGIATPSRRLDVNGSSLFRGAIRYADAGAVKANWEVFQAQVSTTDDTVTTIATVAVPTDSVMLITANVTARRTGGVSGVAGDSATYIRTVKVKNVAGTVTAPKEQADYTSEDDKDYDVSFSISSTNLLIRVEGDITTNVDWSVTYFVQVLS